MISETIKHRMNKIKQNNYDGATVITKQVIHLFTDYLQQYKSGFKNQDVLELKQVIIQFAHLQPSMASIIMVCNQLLTILDKSKKERLFHDLMNYSTTTVQSLQHGSDKINEYAKKIVSNKVKLATYSSSSMVSHFFTFLKENNIKFSVYCSESRPMNEGLTLSEHLSKNNIDVTVMTDASLFSSLQDYDIVLLGADAISKHGVTNKIGSKVITTLAEQYQIPVYTFSLIEKILPYPYDIKTYKQHDQKEITRLDHPHLRIENKYFDKTPLEKITGIITQKGLFQKDEIQSYMHSIKLHDQLKGLLTDHPN